MLCPMGPAICDRVFHTWPGPQIARVSLQNGSTGY